MEQISHKADPKLDICMPEYVGRFEIIDGFQISSYTKPNRVHRFFIKLLLGWKWIDD